MSTIVALAVRPEPSKLCDVNFSGGASLKGVQLAQTFKQIRRGLAGRDQIHSGMLFVWNEAEQRTFWMRNTPVPLSVGFFDEAGSLFAIEDMQPNTDTLHHSGAVAKYALELHQGDFQKLQIKIGTRIEGYECSPAD
ncbi:DUF192 domain-containing protein [Brucella cytisi]|uniref:DUF192 domain-containing protein n=1 Tax=Brucella cytisi TaxID=407152 RepID=UPI00142D5D87|nr:DUF192 domain-containing protein [Brucella cytisi]